jgi:predicted amidohydrolase
MAFSIYFYFMKIAVASPPLPKSIADALFWLEKLTAEAAGQQANIICFPETFLPGYPLEEYDPEKSSPEKMAAALQKATTIARENHIAVILPMDWYRTEKYLTLQSSYPPKAQYWATTPKPNSTRVKMNGGLREQSARFLISTALSLA